MVPDPAKLPGEQYDHLWGILKNVNIITACGADQNYAHRTVFANIEVQGINFNEGQCFMQGGDLVYIKTRNTGTNSVEVHIVDGGSGYKSFKLQTGTALPLHEVPNGVIFWSSNRLFFIKGRNTAQGRIEVWQYTRDQGFQDARRWTTEFQNGDLDNGSWGVRIYGGNDLRLMFIKTRNIGSHIELHTQTKGVGIEDFVTPFGVDEVANGDFRVGCTKTNMDPIYFIKYRNCGSGKIEVHTCFTSMWVAGQYNQCDHYATAWETVAGTDWNNVCLMLGENA